MSIPTIESTSSRSLGLSKADAELARQVLDAEYKKPSLGAQLYVHRFAGGGGGGRAVAIDLIKKQKPATCLVRESSLGVFSMAAIDSETKAVGKAHYMALTVLFAQSAIVHLLLIQDNARPWLFANCNTTSPTLCHDETRPVEFYDLPACARASHGLLRWYLQPDGTVVDLLSIEDVSAYQSVLEEVPAPPPLSAKK